MVPQKPVLKPKHNGFYEIQSRAYSCDTLVDSESVVIYRQLRSIRSQTSRQSLACVCTSTISVHALYPGQAKLNLKDSLHSCTSREELVQISKFSYSSCLNTFVSVTEQKTLMSYEVIIKYMLHLCLEIKLCDKLLRMLWICSYLIG